MIVETSSLNEKELKTEENSQPAHSKTMQNFRNDSDTCTHKHSRPTSSLRVTGMQKRVVNVEPPKVVKVEEPVIQRPKPSIQSFVQKNEAGT